MAQAAVTYGGQIIRITNFTQTRFHYKSGLLMSFFLGNDKYTYSYPADFRIEDQDQVNALGGYYVESAFLDYSVKKITREELSAHRLPDSQIILAVDGDIINSHIFYLVSPYSDFCKYGNYTWTYDKNALPLDSHGNIIFPSGTPPTVPVSLNVNALAFYRKNISLITSSDYTDDKDLGAYNLALCAMKIDVINRDIFPLFNGSQELADYVVDQNIEWSTGTIFNQPTLVDIQQYLLNLENFYVAAYPNQVLIKDALPDIKMFWLANILSVSGVSVFSVDQKIKLLTAAIETQMVSSKLNDAEFMLKMVSSVSLVPTQIDDFLGQLISTKFYDINGKEQTLFETIYLNVADNEQGRVTMGLYNQPNNRKAYIETLHSLWLTSKYNPYFDSPSYSQPADTLGFFPESYFMTPTGKSNYDTNTAPPVFVYTAANDLLTALFGNFFFSIQNEKIIAYKTPALDGRPLGDILTASNLYGTYHIFAPVAILGYKSDLDLAMPENNCIPIFYQYYAADYKNIKDIEAGILLIRDVFLTYALFGSSNSFSYIKALSGLADLSNTQRVILIWEAVQGLSGTVQFTAGMAAALSDYIKQTTTDPDILSFMQSVDKFLIVLTLATVSTDILTKQRLVIAADDVISEQQALINAGKPVNLNDDVINAITAVANNKPLLINLMRSKISTLELTEVSTRFAALDASVQYDFFRDFYNLNDSAAWTQLNETYQIIVKGPDGTIISSTTNILVDEWSLMEDADDLRQDISFLNDVKFIKTSQELNLEVFYGRYGKELKSAGLDPTLANSYKWEGKGVHHKSALQANDPNSVGYIVTGTKVDLVPEGLGYYKAKVEIYNPDFPYNQNSQGKTGWKVKDSKRGMSTFFPDSWSKQKVQQEIALGYKSGKNVVGNQWIGKMSDGVEIKIYIENGIPTSAHPNL